MTILTHIKSELILELDLEYHVWRGHVDNKAVYLYRTQFMTVRFIVNRSYEIIHKDKVTRHLNKIYTEKILPILANKPLRLGNFTSFNHYYISKPF